MRILLLGVFLALTSYAENAATKPEPQFKRLPFGSVRPAGWMKAQLEQDARGGVLHYYHRNWQVQNRAFELRAHNPAKIGNNPHIWDGGAESYWGYALITSAILANDPALKQQADTFVASILKTQDPDGYIGIYDATNRFQPATIDVGLGSFLFLGLVDYAQAYGRQDVLLAVERAVQCIMRNFNRTTTNLWVPSFAVMHYPQMLDVLAQVTGKPEYADHAAFVVENFNHAPNSLSYFADCRLGNLLDTNRLFIGHACNTTGGLCAPWLAYYTTGDFQYKQAGENAFAKFNCQMSVSGSLPGDEDNNGRAPLPEIGIEFCTTTYLVESALIVGEKTGDSRMFDIAERCFFNAGMGARLPDGTAHAYLKRDNEFSLNYPGIFHRYEYSPAHEPYCCTTRMMSLLPVFVSHMFKKTTDGRALAAVAYGPATMETEIAGKTMRVEEKTLYPFDGKIVFGLTPEKPVTFEFMVRLPTWSPAAQIKCDGASIERQGDYYVVKKLWSPGDSVAVAFATPVEAIHWPNNEYVLKSGPLVFALDLGKTPTKHDKFPSGYTIEEFCDGKLPIYDFAPNQNIALWWSSLDGTTRAPAFGFKRVVVKTENPDVVQVAAGIARPIKPNAVEV